MTDKTNNGYISEKLYIKFLLYITSQVYFISLYNLIKFYYKPIIN